MKYLITESQMNTFFQDYLEKFRPDLFNLSVYPTRRKDKSVYGYEFELPNTLILIFEYLKEPEDNSESDESYPKLRITYKLGSEIEGMFGEKGIELLVKWFENHYKLPVKSIIKPE